MSETEPPGGAIGDLAGRVRALQAVVVGGGIAIGLPAKPWRSWVTNSSTNLCR